MNPLMKLAIAGFLDDVSSIIAPIGAKDVLDLACGEGFVSGSLASHGLVGMDISRSALDIARKNSPGAAFACGDICGTPFKPESFDLVVALEVLEHLKEPEKAIIEVGRLSRRYCLFSVPREPYFRAMDLLRGKNITRLGNDVEHLHNWTYNEFVRLISRYYDIVDVKKPFPWTMILCEKKQSADKI
jgi:2-polyprenyl-3-methyl-5-hydroxy-6-metoxy-1,4-benzoquinol methylase